MTSSTTGTESSTTGTEASTTGTEASTTTEAESSSTTEAESSTTTEAESTGPGGELAHLQGLWQTQGYGWIYAVADSGLQIYEVTSESCTQLIGGTLVAAEDEAGLQAVATLEVPGLFKLGMEVLAGSDDTRKHFLADGLVTSPPALRIESLPPACDAEPAVDDLSIFDVVVANFDEHYALFGDRALDWPALVTAQRTRLTASTPAPLFDVLVALLEPLQDAHVSLQTPEGAFEGRRPEVEPITEEMIAEANTIVEERYLQAPLDRAVADQVGFGHLSEEIGYLVTDGFGPLFTDDGTLDYSAGVAELETFLDATFTGSTMEGLVIDLRNNGGGSDRYGLAIAARLAEEPYTPFSVRSRIDPDDVSVYGEAVPISVTPSERPRFAGPVVVLIGRNTVSAAETFALALRGQPGVTLIGEPSQGAFSSVLNHFLPNGWLLGLPNEHYVTPVGERFDVVGITPDIEAPAVSAEDLAAGRDSALDAALALLTDAP